MSVHHKRQGKLAPKSSPLTEYELSLLQEIKDLQTEIRQLRKDA